MYFERVIVGIDGTRASYEAARQAARLTRPDGTLTLLAAADPFLALVNRWGTGRLVDPVGAGTEVLPQAVQRLDERAREVLGTVRALLPADLAVTEQVVERRSWEALREAAGVAGADLIAVGSHGDRRMIGAARASTATELLHDAPCSVLVARGAFDPPAFPASLVVGLDGSDGSLAARDVAAAIVAAGGGAAGAFALTVPAAGIEVEGLERIARPLRLELRRGRPVEALVEAAAGADLLVLGARGLSGVRSLGSVSERVAHRAESSVLVVRVAAEGT